MVLYYLEDNLGKNNAKNKFEVYKKAFLKSNQYDVEILINLIRCFKYFLITPFSFEEGHPKFGKYLSVLLTLTWFVSCYFSVKISYHMLMNTPITNFLLNTLWCITNMLFIITCFLNANIFKQQNWKAVLKFIGQAEDMLRKLNFQSPKQNLRLVLQVVSIFLPYISTTSLRLYLWISSNKMKLFYIYGALMVVQLYIYLFMLLMLRLTSILKVRYDFVAKNLRNIAMSSGTDQDKTKKLAEIVRLYRILINLIENISNIFGPHLFLYVSVSVIYFLSAVTYNLRVNSADYEQKNTSVMTIINTICYTVSLVVLIMSCDALESSGKKVIKTCYLLHQNTESRLLKGCLLQLAQYAEQWRPTLSAAGFYDINQSTLSAVFVAIITYLVIIIQFNMDLDP